MACTKSRKDATGLPRGVFMFAAKQNQNQRSPDATALCRGVSRLLLRCSYLASNVNPPRPRPWHPVLLLKIIGGSNQREVPRDKPVASFFDFCASQDEMLWLRFEKMPRARPVEFSCLLLHRIKIKVSRCHGLVPWSLTFAATFAAI